MLGSCGSTRILGELRVTDFVDWVGWVGLNWATERCSVVGAHIVMTPLAGRAAGELLCAVAAGFQFWRMVAVPRW
jgi:hypothetical protein